MSVVPHITHTREIGKREERIAQLEMEIERLGNIIAAQADQLAARPLTFTQYLAQRTA